MNTKFTPGPWEIDRNNEIWSVTNSKLIAECLHDSLPDGNDNAPFEQLQANARLIAAAPELLETLEGLKKALSRMIDKHDPDSIESEWIGEAHEVILKATDPNYKTTNP